MVTQYDIKSVTFIDTLYLYGYVDISHSFYEEYVVSGRFSPLGVSGGYHWFINNENGDRVGVCEQFQADKMNSYPVVYQYSKKNCHDMNFSTYSNHISLNKCQVKRLDVAITFQNPDYVIYDTVISPFRSIVTFRGKNNEIETLYLGKRQSGKIVRHYNKTLELKETNNYLGMDHYSSIFGGIDDLFTIECEITRKHIVSKFGHVDYGSIQNLISYCLDTVSLCVFFPDTDENKINYKNNNYELIHGKVSHFSEDITYICKYDPKVSKVSLFYLYERSHRLLENYVNSVPMKDNELDYFYMSYFSAIINRFSHDTLLDYVEFKFRDEKESVVLKKELMSKVEKLRNFQTNELEIEAKNLFG